jgi:hypothetical protein
VTLIDKPRATTFGVRWILGANPPFRAQEINSGATPPVKLDVVPGRARAAGAASRLSEARPVVREGL